MPTIRPPRSARPRSKSWRASTTYTNPPAISSDRPADSRGPGAGALSAAPITAAPSTSPTMRSRIRAGKASHRYSTSPSSATTTTRSPQAHAGPRKIRARSVGMAIAAVASLARSTSALPVLLLAGESETTLALLIVLERAEKLRFAEVRPQGVGHVELGIGDLPEEEVRDAHLAAGADEQVRIGKARGAEVGGHGRLVDGVRVQLAGAHGARDATRGLDDVLAAAVTDAQADRQSRVGAGQLDDALELASHRFGQAAGVADGEHPHLVLHELLHLGAQVAQQQAHERVHLAPRPLPVLGREREQAQV